MFIQKFSSTQIPKILNNSSYSSDYLGYSLILQLSEKKMSKLKLNRYVKRALKHYEMVESARGLYKEGSVISWDEFLKNASK